jgi:hypothetical protein
MMKFNRRDALTAMLFGAGGIGLRALATGIPAAFLLNPKKAMAAGCGNMAKAQYFIMSTAAGGDPINAGAAGTYSDPNIIHSSDPTMAATALSLGGVAATAAKPWSTLPQWALDRTTFWHLMTGTPIHPKEPDVLELMGATNNHEMLPSVLSQAVAPCLGCVQPTPLSIGGAGPSEAFKYNGAAIPIIPPVALKDTLTSPAGPLANLQALRDQTMNSIYAMYKTSATPQEQAFIDQTVNTQAQVRSLNQTLLNNLSMIKDNSVASQITAAVTLLQMNIAPLISLHIPFGGDNHSDQNLATETAQTVSGVASIASLMTALQAVNLQDKVTFFTLNVFGRTLATNGGASAANGRNHNPNHQVSVTIGAPFKAGVVGGVAPVAGDYGCTQIDSTTGNSVSSGDIGTYDTLGSFGMTLLQGVGGDPTVLNRGKVIQGALM